jgi:hypothetical protein
MTRKSSEVEPQGALTGPLGASDFPLHVIDGQLVIVAVTPAVERLARAARGIAKERETLETGHAQMLASRRAAR